MARVFQQDRSLFKRDILTKAVYKAAEAFAGLFKREGRTAFKALMASEQRPCEKTCNVSKFPDIYPDIEGFLWEHGKQRQMRVRFAVGSHRCTHLDEQQRSVSFFLQHRP